jgi:hypothetical protein
MKHPRRQKYLLDTDVLFEESAEQRSFIQTEKQLSTSIRINLNLVSDPKETE